MQPRPRDTFPSQLKVVKVRVPAKAVAGVAALAIAGFTAYAASAPHAVAVPVPVIAAPAPVTAGAPEVAPGLKQVAIPVPPVVTGLPYPTSCKAVGKLPDPVCTPGSVNPAVTQATIGSTICTHGWTATVRPSASNTNPVKTASMRAYGEPSTARGTTELDHLIPLELGGSDDVTNLWGQPSDEPGHGVNNSKDGLENRLKSAVCSGKVILDAARSAIASDWTTAEAKLGLHP